MRKILIISLLLFSCQASQALDFGKISPVNPLDRNPNTYQTDVEIPVFDLKRATLTRNDVKNQYTIAMDKFINIDENFGLNSQNKNTVSKSKDYSFFL